MTFVPLPPSASPDLWRQRPVGIVGLGLIGGSLGLDLQQLGVEVRALVHRDATAERARQRGLASEVSTDPSVLSPCGLVVLALPLDRLLAPAGELVAALPPQAVITDVGSVKTPVLACWSGLVPRFVASHPMAGTAQSGVDAGQLGLFQGRPWVATPQLATDPEALLVVQGLAEALGADWLCCGPEAHDQAVALISHLPVLLGAALLQAAAGAEVDPALVRRLASSGFADTTRVGGGNPELGSLMARCNRSALLAALAEYRRTLEQVEGLIQDSQWPALQQTLASCQELRPEFL
ncbi:MAG: prephenate/arogenate dehydrogenase [Cyanobium sp.]